MLLRFFPFLFFFLLLTAGFAQEGHYVLKESAIGRLTILNVPWKFHPGDDLRWADPEWDDSAWESRGTALDTAHASFKGICWFRLHVVLDSSVMGLPMKLTMQQNGASELYIDGELISTRGTVSGLADQEKRHNPYVTPIFYRFGEGANHVIAVRYSNTRARYNYKTYGETQAGFTLMVGKNDPSFSQEDEPSQTKQTLLYLSGFFCALGLLHFLFFLFYRPQKLNFYYSLFMLALGMFFLTLHGLLNSENPDTQIRLVFLIMLLIPFFLIALLGVLHSLFFNPMPKLFWFLAALLIPHIILMIAERNYAYILILVVMVAVCIESIRTVVVALLKKKKGARIIGAGVLCFILTILTIVVMMIVTRGFLVTDQSGLIILGSILCIPLSTSIYLAWDFSCINNDLAQQLKQVKTLSQKALEQEMEKKMLIEGQKEQLEIQVAQRTAEVVRQKEEIQEQNKAITDSINYAKRIQTAILPLRDDIRRVFPDSFVLYMPKDIVSGDFYWFCERDDLTFIAACDCTGHGVPGAFMSMIGSNILNQLVMETRLSDPSDILNTLNRKIKLALKQSGEEGETRDGMDIALCCFEPGAEGSLKLSFAGAHRPLWIIRKGEDTVNEIPADKAAIGGLTSEAFMFSTRCLELHKGDTLYLFTDGYADQFGGPHGKKMLSRRLREALYAHRHLPMEQQGRTLKQAFAEWMGNHEQVDDVLLIGIRMA